jgi:hypothetical protein
MIVDAHLRCSGRERCDDVLRSLDATTRLLLQLVAGREPARRFGTLHEAARPIRANGAAVKAAAAAPR